MANDSCDVATRTQRQFILAQTINMPIRKGFRIFPNGPPIDPSKLMFSEIMERFRGNSSGEDHDQPAQAPEIELDEDDLSEILSEFITDLVEINYGKNFNCHVCALLHLDIGAMNLDEKNAGAGNDVSLSIEAIRYASYFLKNCDGACVRRYMRGNPPQPRPKADDYEEFRLLK